MKRHLRHKRVIAFKTTNGQAAYVFQKAKELDLSASQFIRRLIDTYKAEEEKKQNE